MMENEELLGRWNRGYEWLTKHEQITGTNKNRLGEIYDHTLYLLALRRIEFLEDEMRKRVIKHGRD